MTEFTRAGVSVGSHVRVVRPSPLAGLSGAVSFVNDSSGLYEVHVDGGRWRGRPPILVTRDEVALVPCGGEPEGDGQARWPTIRDMTWSPPSATHPCAEPAGRCNRF